MKTKKLSKGVPMSALAAPNNEKKYKLSNKGEEHRFQKAFVNGEVECDNIKYVDHEIVLFPALKILTEDIRRDIIDENSGNLREGNTKGFGRIDLIVKSKSKFYCVEIKYNNKDSNDFWRSLKVIGYTEYYKWQTHNNMYLPAVIIPKDTLRLEHQIVAGRCGVTIFTVDKKGETYYLKMLDDRPYWKQSQPKNVPTELLTEL